VCCRVLECVRVCFRVLECVGVRWSVLECVAVCCSVLQYVAVCCSVLQCAAVCWYTEESHCMERRHAIILWSSAGNNSFVTGCITNNLMCVCIQINVYVGHCNTLQRTATHCNTLWCVCIKINVYVGLLRRREPTYGEETSHHSLDCWGGKQNSGGKSFCYREYCKQFHVCVYVHICIYSALLQKRQQDLWLRSVFKILSHICICKGFFCRRRWLSCSLQHIANDCNTLQHTATVFFCRRQWLSSSKDRTAVLRGVLQTLLCVCVYSEQFYVCVCIYIHICRGLFLTRDNNNSCYRVAKNHRMSWVADYFPHKSH